jgi:hypothetical protein
VLKIIARYPSGRMFLIVVDPATPIEKVWELAMSKAGAAGCKSLFVDWRPPLQTDIARARRAGLLIEEWSPEKEEEKINWRPYTPGEADIFTVREFQDMCDERSVIDYDGFGHYAMKRGEDVYISNIKATPSDFTNGLISDKYTHVAWYNK